ncbi:prepilin-type N-terminal cleavage/methylation domain-containing protein [Paucibacter sp. DJ1R-11]|uniref:pilus assembly FimT family protein n=1 Tax=Paucibacter sp. DJ1R-11 TaxID=2893556 RepID=UPI0021E4E5D4|nr:prepilin-type N-terminal cleavage/methylation domain-containing protein [Paucibacter sp. DJ1R-11]MCV2366030.1 prepilin-type N-terminal cleavage/methylation domain-containing protein [Paucibacter sp. DJ1R-11]
MKPHTSILGLQRGVSLIEMMVTVAVMMLLALAAAPFTSSWGSQASVRQTQTLLMQGMSQLKALALRNPAATSATAAAVLVAVPGQLCVRQGIPATLDCSAVSWTSVPPASIKLNNATSQCVALDSSGSPVAATVGATVCGTALSFEVSKGTETSSGTLN